LSEEVAVVPEKRAKIASAKIAVLFIGYLLCYSGFD